MISGILLLAAIQVAPVEAAPLPRLKPMSSLESSAKPAAPQVKSPLTKEDVELIFTRQDGVDAVKDPIPDFTAKFLGLVPPGAKIPLPATIYCWARVFSDAAHNGRHLCRMKNGDYIFFSLLDDHYHHIRTDPSFQFVAGAINHTSREDTLRNRVKDTEPLLGEEGLPLLLDDLTVWADLAARLRAPPR